MTYGTIYDVDHDTLVAQVNSFVSDVTLNPGTARGIRLIENNDDYYIVQRAIILSRPRYNATTPDFQALFRITAADYTMLTLGDMPISTDIANKTEIASRAEGY